VLALVLELLELQKRRRREESAAERQGVFSRLLRARREKISSTLGTGKMRGSHQVEEEDSTAQEDTQLLRRGIPRLLQRVVSLIRETQW